MKDFFVEKVSKWNLSICKPKFVMLLVLCITFTAFIPALDHEFLNFDDPIHLTHNEDIVTFDLAAMFRNTVNKIYVPLTSLSFAVEYKIFGPIPFIYHLDNLLLHLCVTALVFYFALHLGLSVTAAGFGALLFGIHPMHVESVAWVTERKDVLYSFFYMLSLISYWKFLSRERKYKHYFLSLLFGFFSILAKPMALSLPLVLLVLDYYHSRMNSLNKHEGHERWWLNRDAWLTKIPFFLYVIPVTWITYSLHERFIPVEPDESILVAIWTFTFYIQKFIFPFNLHPLYELPQPIALFHPQYLFACVILIFYSHFIFQFRKHTLFTFANAFFIASIFFIVRFQHSLDLHVVADRFMYLPSLGYCLVFGFLVQRIWNLMSAARNNIIIRAGFVVIMAAIITSLSIKTYQQTKIWKNEYHFWNYAVNTNPYNNLVYGGRARMHESNGNYQAAILDYSKAIALAPNLAVRAYNNRGSLFATFKAYAAALKDFNRVLEIHPGYAKGYNNRGLVYYYLHKDHKALDDFNRSITINPKSASTYMNRGNLYRVTDRHALAINDYNKAIKIFPKYAKVYHFRSLSFSATGQKDRAREDSKRAEALGFVPPPAH